MIDMIKKSKLYRNEPRVKKWLDDNNVGTVHTFQGQGTDEVIFLLGCDSNFIGAANWVNKNIVNVAATRAKFRFYMIGDQTVWTCKPVKTAREITKQIITPSELDSLLTLSKIDESEPTNQLICPKCGKSLLEKNGRYGKFLGCSGFPKCDYTKSV